MNKHNKYVSPASVAFHGGWGYKHTPTLMSVTNNQPHNTYILEDGGWTGLAAEERYGSKSRKCNGGRL